MGGIKEERRTSASRQLSSLQYRLSDSDITVHIEGKQRQTGSVTCLTVDIDARIARNLYRRCSTFKAEG